MLLMSKFTKISMQDYKLIPALSSHDLMTVIKHPDDWQKYLFEGYHDPVDEKLQARFDVGTLFHTMVLEPELLKEEYQVLSTFNSEIDLTSSRPIIHAYDVNRPVFTGSDYTIADLYNTRNRVYSDPDSLLLIDRIDKAEHSIDWKCPRTGLYFRGRPDAVLKDGGVVDLKTASRNDHNSFMRSVEAFNYDMQAAFYCDTCNTKDFYWIACSLKNHSVEVYKATNEQLGRGWEKNEYAKRKILEYLNG